MKLKPYPPAPWKYDGIYIWAGNGDMVADQPSSKYEADAAHLARVRGVGRGATVAEQENVSKILAASVQFYEAAHDLVNGNGGPIASAEVQAAQEAMTGRVGFVDDETLAAHPDDYVMVRVEDFMRLADIVDKIEGNVVVDRG